MAFCLCFSNRYIVFLRILMSIILHVFLYYTYHILRNNANPFKICLAFFLSGGGARDYTLKTCCFKGIISISLIIEIYCLNCSNNLAILAAYSLMQLYLLREDMKELANKTISTITKKEKAGECVVILYSGSHYGVFDLDEYSFILMKLKTDAKNRLAERIKTWSNAPP